MAIKIDSNTPAVAHHVIDGPVEFPYAIDAHSAVSRFPGEWSFAPWSQADMAAARNESGAPEVKLTPEEQAAIDEHAKAVAEANERLAARRAKLEAARKEADQVAADEALVRSAPPRPDPARRPLTPAQIRRNAAELTPAEQADVDAKKADDERIAREKHDADLINSASKQGSG